MQNGVKINIIEWDGETPLGGLELELVPDDGEPLGYTPTQEDEYARIEALYAACKAWQSRPLNQHTCDDLFASKLIDYQERAILNGESFGPKTVAAMQWLATLWADYDARKANGSTDYDFSSHGGCPHSFNEVRIERLGG